MKGLIFIMKLKMAAVAALMVCALCSCGGSRDKTGSIYTPAPVTPRPTFDTVKYRTKEEITAKQDEEFVIYDNFPKGSYPSRRDEYVPKIEVDNEALALAADEEKRLREEEKKRVQEEYEQQVELVKQAVHNAYEQATQPAKSESEDSSDSWDYYDSGAMRTKDSIPDGFSSRNYPYSLYSFDGRTYLGKITTDVSDENSIWNTSGIYGSADSPLSIFNPNCIYGADDAIFSSFNENASSPPIIIDSKGNKIGKLTTNLRIEDGIDPNELKLYATDNNM